MPNNENQLKYRYLKEKFPSTTTEGGREREKKKYEKNNGKIRTTKEKR